MLLGGVYTQHAFLLRGGAYASEASESQWAGYRQYQALAQAAFAADPEAQGNNPAWYGARLGTATTDVLEPKAFAELLRQGLAVAPDYNEPLRAVVHCAAPQWGGSAPLLEQMGQVVLKAAGPQACTVMCTEAYRKDACRCHYAADQLKIQWPTFEEGARQRLEIIRLPYLVDSDAAIACNSGHEQFLQSLKPLLVEKGKRLEIWQSFDQQPRCMRWITDLPAQRARVRPRTSVGRAPSWRPDDAGPKLRGRGGDRGAACRARREAGQSTIALAANRPPMSSASPPSGSTTRPLIREPRLAPVIGTDAQLPAVPAERLVEQAVRARFAATLRMPADGAGDDARWTPEFTGDGQRLAGRTLRPAAVLVPLVRRPGGLTVLLTRRTDHLNDHAGQVSFPGGRTDPEDADAVATALREAHEEVGIEPDEVEVIGLLPHYTTVTAYEVTPIVGLLDPPRALRLDAFEVAEVFEVPLAFLMDPANHRRHAVEVDGLARQFISMPWGEDARGEPYFVWGATAAMLRNLYRFLAR